LPKKEQIKSVAKPKIGTGVGGLDWSEVKPLIENHLSKPELEAFKYSEYKKGVA